MKLLITGASGFVGKMLCAELFQQGHSVRVAVRSANVQVDDFERAIVGSIDSGADWSAALHSVPSPPASPPRT
ncbi:MAG: NAD-dependent epimerase/dehydratase family protein [Methylococcales bacterium]|nr:NAD-dependent epimerase/dehydratase family protein [Methylococcales bacterium]